MRTLYLKIILFIFLAFNALYNTMDATTLLVLLTILSGMLLNDFWLDKPRKYVLCLAVCSLTVIHPLFALGLPLLIFEAVHPLFIGIMWVFSFFSLDSLSFMIMIGFSLTLFVAVNYEAHIKQLTADNSALMDTINAQKYHAQQKQEDLIVKQQQSLDLSLLNERNRIARDIHDNVGHLLTSALLQVGAMRVINPSSDLDILKDTLDKGMNAIRSSVHSLYNNSFNLDSEIQSSFKEYSTLVFDYKYSLIHDPDSTIKAAFLFIVKEAINNTAKHSNATSIKIHLDESKQYYHCLIQDNGTSINPQTSAGIGLLSLEKRVKDAHGIINIQPEIGYRIYVNIPKEVPYETCNN